MSALLAILGASTDGMTVATASVKALRGWLKRDESHNLLASIEGEIAGHWPGEATRADIYSQLGRLLQEPDLWIAFAAATAGE